MGLHRNNQLPRYDGLPLSDDQIAAARLLTLGISEYSESAYAAGWMEGIEHEVWDRFYPPLPDSYDIAIQRLNRAAGRIHTDPGDVCRELLRGLQLVCEQHRVWVYWDDQTEDTAIHLDDWKPMHLHWRAAAKAKRPSLEQVWSNLHYDHKLNGPRPGMPALPDLSDLNLE